MQRTTRLQPLSRQRNRARNGGTEVPFGPGEDRSGACPVRRLERVIAPGQPDLWPSGGSPEWPRGQQGGHACLGGGPSLQEVRRAGRGKLLRRWNREPLRSPPAPDQPAAGRFVAGSPKVPGQLLFSRLQRLQSQGQARPVRELPVHPAAGESVRRRAQYLAGHPRGRTGCRIHPP